MKIAHIMLIACISIAACKKSKEQSPGPAEKTNREVLTSGKWVIDYGYATYRDLHTHDTVVSPTTFHPCSLDDTLFFTITDKVIAHKGQIACQGEPFTVDSSSNWEFTNNGHTIKSSGGFGPDVEYTVDKLTADTLTLQFGNIGIGSNQHTIVYKNLK